MLGQESVLPEAVLGWPLAEWMEAHERQLEAWGLESKARFFRNVGNPKGAAWAENGEAVNRLLKRVVEQTVKRHGLVRPTVGDYSSHSMRRGGAQYLRDQGVSREMIKIMGRWRSDAVDAYLDSMERKAMTAVSALFARGGRGA